MLAQDFSDPESIAWKVGYHLDDAAYSKLWDANKADGYLPIDIEMDAGGARYAGVWQKNTDGRGWGSWRRLTSDDFHQHWDEYSRKGYRALDQDSEVIGGKELYSLIMVENRERLDWVSNRNLTSDQLAANVAEHKGKYKPIDIDAIEVGGKMRYSIIWVANPTKEPWAELRDMTPDAYGKKFTEYLEKGYRVVDLECYERSGELTYAAIWEKNEAGRAWVALRQMSAASMRNNWHKYSDQGMRIVDIEVCPAESGSGDQFAAIWRENGDRYDWAGRREAEQALTAYAAKADIPGVGAAIMRDGRSVFRGGAGFADSGEDIAANGGTIYRLASVAKAVTGTLAYDLEEGGIVNLDNRTDSIVTGLGTQHRHTLRQLLQNTGCVEHYTSDGLDDNGTQVEYASAQAALNGHLGGALKTNSWIVSGCGVGTWNYSTHGYTLAAAGLEVRTRSTFADLVRTRIAGPLDLETLRAEVRSSPNATGERASINDGAAQVSRAKYENVSWKAGGSGIESSAADLATFGDAVLRNRYFPRATRDRMWSGGTSSSQANGWTINAAATQVDKSGANQGADSHIRIDVGNGVTVVALTNTEAPSVDTRTLTQQLMTIALAKP